MNEEKNSLWTLSKIGVFVGGIALLVIAFVFLSFYVEAFLLFSKHGNEMLSAYCSDKIVIINAFREANDIQVQDMEGKTICTFEKIPSNSSEFCKVGSEGVFAVTSGERKQAVECNGFAGYPPASYD